MIAEFANLPQADLIFLGIVCFAAGLVRGFAGFALSALVMAIAVTILPPVELIPILWFLEMTASLMMARGGWLDADKTAALILVLGNFFGWPIGLYLTTSLSVSASKTVALIVVLTLAASQLGNLRLPFLASRVGTGLAGFVAGIVSGLAHVGGMIVALYALSRDSDAKTMRGTLVTYLFVASIGSFFIQLAFGTMNFAAFNRAIVLIPTTAAGVFIGQKMFIPAWQPYYRPFCLWLLMGLAGYSLIRQIT